MVFLTIFSVLQSLRQMSYMLGPRGTTLVEGDSHQDTFCYPNILIYNVHIPHPDPETASLLWTVACCAGQVISTTAYTGEEPEEPFVAKWAKLDGEGGILLPSLCHAHIHLDKCFILDKCDPLVSGNFNEALKVTNKAKSRFPEEQEDLFARARKLVSESVEAGVTCMRAHVEVDTVVKYSCLEMAQKLSKEWRMTCDIQIAVFAQEPLFDSREDKHPGRNFEILQTASSWPGVRAIGSAPYVEPSTAHAKRNIDLILALSQRLYCHADFHLDYNVNPLSEPLIYYVLERVRGMQWGGTVRISEFDEKVKMHVTLGHCTRLTLFSPAQLRDLMEGLPITIVGLPQSDMYMMGRDEADMMHGPRRGTLRVPMLAREYGIDVAMSVNNVYNAFTPQGSLDPLSLCTLGAGLFQAATPEDLLSFLKSVTCTAKRALGEPTSQEIALPVKGDRADFVLLHHCTKLQEALLTPNPDRVTIRGGRIVARQYLSRWNEVSENTTLEERMQMLDDKTLPAPPVQHPAPWYRRLRWMYFLFPPLFMYKWWTSQLMAKPPVERFEFKKSCSPRRFLKNGKKQQDGSLSPSPRGLAPPSP